MQELGCYVTALSGGMKQSLGSHQVLLNFAFFSDHHIKADLKEKKCTGTPRVICLKLERC